MEAAERVEVLLAAMALRRVETADGQAGLRPLSTAEIRAASAGEVTGPELLSYRTQQPEPGGLLCERIFGPLDDPEARSRRLGHVELPLPVVHPLFAARVARVLGLEPREVELLEAGGAYLLKNVPEGVELLVAGRVLPAPLYRDAKAGFRERLEGACGAEGVRGGLAGREAGPGEGRPEWMVLEAVPVLPPGLREPAGEGAAAGLEETETVLYRRLIGRCQRMRKLIELEVPERLGAAEAGLLRSMLHALFRNEDLPRPYWGLDGPVRGLLGRLRREAAAAGVALPPLG